MARGDVVGLTGGVGTDHDGRVLHLGLRIGDRYVDPMLLFRPATSPKLVRLVPAGDPPRRRGPRPASGATLQSSLRLPTPGADVEPWRDARADDSCDTDVPLRRRRASTRPATSGTWVGDRADARGRRRSCDFLDATTGLGSDGVRRAAHDGGDDHVAPCARCRRSSARALARTPAGMLALDVVTIGRRFADTVTADCSDDASDADGSGGSAHRVMVVAGIDSAGQGVGPRADGRARRRRRSGTTSTRARSATTRTPPTAARYTRDRHPRSDRGRRRSDSRSSSAPCSASSPAARSTSSRTRRVGSSSTSSCRMCIARVTGRFHRSATW